MSIPRNSAGTAVVVAVLVSLMLLATEAGAQSRGRSIRIPSRSGSGLRLPSAMGRGGRGGLTGRSGSRGNLFSGSSRSGFSGLDGLGALLENAGRNYGHGDHRYWDHDRGYSHAEAYRDVGIANAVVDLVGILVNASAYQTYAPAAAPVEMAPAPVEPIPVPSAAPVTVVPAPTVIVQTPTYSAPPYVHLTPPRAPMPRPRAHPGYSGRSPAPGSYDRYHGGYSRHKTPTRLRKGPRMTPQRTPLRQSRPMAGGSRTAPRSSRIRKVSPSVRRTPVKTTSWSYRVR